MLILSILTTEQTIYQPIIPAIVSGLKRRMSECT